MNNHLHLIAHSFYEMIIDRNIISNDYNDIWFIDSINIICITTSYGNFINPFLHAVFFEDYYFKFFIVLLSNALNHLNITLQNVLIIQMRAKLSIDNFRIQPCILFLQKVILYRTSSKNYVSYWFRKQFNYFLFFDRMHVKDNDFSYWFLKISTIQFKFD